MTGNDHGVSVFFESDGGSLVGFYGLALTYVIRSEARVDEILAEAEKAGATVLKPAGALPWGGYGGTFADPDGYIWSLGYSDQGTDQPYAE
ncbi:VOC family protein [Amycolatopsis nigrescens]|uniref:VOC family protein n=1 Tax=Amycolatopsis nigrescens TaxID=381445 RepID=UPI000379A8CB|nr:VOC family protein [Amycolatopsis nigrescens]